MTSFCCNYSYKFEAIALQSLRDDLRDVGIDLITSIRQSIGRWRLLFRELPYPELRLR